MSSVLSRPPFVRVPIIQLTPRWTAHVRTEVNLDVTFGTETLPEDGEFGAGKITAVVLNVSTLREADGCFSDAELIPFLIREGQPELDASGCVKIFGSRRIGAGTWVVTPSLNIECELHAFLILCGVPEPAPWVTA